MQSEKQRLLPEKVKGKSNFKLEPAVLFVYFGWHLSAATIPSQLLRHTCMFYEADASTCDANNASTDVESRIQPKVAAIITTIAVLNAVVPGVLSLFFGPWTDKFGRKKVICAAMFGYALALVMLSIVSHLSDRNYLMNPWIFVVPYIPIILTGGWSTMVISTMCYITDISDEASRSIRLTILEIITFCGILSGVGACSFVLKLVGPTNVFLLSTVCVTTAAIYTKMNVDESIDVDRYASLSEQLGELFSLEPVVEMVKTCFERRAFKARRILWCLILLLVFNNFTTQGAHNLNYLFFRQQFHWTLREYSLYDSSAIFISVIGSFIGLTVMKKLFKLGDIAIATVAIVSGITDACIKATAQSEPAIYLAAGICMMKTLVVPISRSLIVTFIPRSEIGKVFSFTSSLEAALSVFASPLYAYVYSRTFIAFAGAFFVITATICAINLFLISCVMRLKERREHLMAQLGMA